MASEAKSGSRALVSPDSGGAAEGELETALRGVEGKVRNAIVVKLRALVDRDPAAFVRNMRTWMDQGRTDD